jgi:hypothetical protein
MSRFSRSVRIAVAGLLAVSAVTVFAVSPASAVVTGSLANDGNGGLLVTYSPSPGTQSNGINLEVYPSTSSCGTYSDLLAVFSSDPAAPANAQIAASPATLVVGSSGYALQQGAQQPFTLANSEYYFCLYGNSGDVLASLVMTIGQATPTTTTTTAPAADPVTPAFTG